MNKKYLLGLLVIIPLVLVIQNVNAERNTSDDTYKLFDDGVTYKITTSNGLTYSVQDVSIIHEGNEIDCVPDGWHRNQYLNPLCIEIILRSIP